MSECPFCEGEVYEIYVGNEITGFRQSEIGCSKCHFKRTQKFLHMRHDIEWIRQVTRAAWNRRADGWIPCGERLPEDVGIVNTADERRCVYYGWYGAHDGEEPHWHEEYSMRHGMGKITHWQPLPTAPEGVSDDAES